MAQKRTRLPKAVREEERWLDRVRDALASVPAPASTLDYDAKLVELRDAMSEERLPDDQASLLEQMDRLAALSDARARYIPKQIDSASPYFAHLGLSVDESENRDIFLGKQTFVKNDVRIVDWRNAPISRVFYGYREGDYYTEEIAGREITGEVLSRRTVTIVGGRLVRVSSRRGTFLHTSEGWQDISVENSALHGGAGTATRPDTAQPVLGVPDGDRRHRSDKHLPEVAALLGQEQFELLTRQGESLLVVSGSAGSGKTTVGLHRLAYLTFQEPARYRPQRMQVLVFGPALARYISKVLPALGVTGVPVRTLNDWAGMQLRRNFPGLPRRTCSYSPAPVVRFKTHRIMIPMLDQAALDSPNTDPAALFDELFTDREWIRSGIELYAPEAFSDSEINQIHRWCTDQQFRRFEGTDPEEDELPCFDEEDPMILLRLYQLLKGPLRFSKRRSLSYDHLLVDEAQDFSPLELQVLMETVRGHSLTLAGDPAQKITDNDFSSWTEVLEAVGEEHFEVSPLNVSYRSTREIMNLAQAVLGPLAPEDPPQATRSGAAVELLRFGGAGEALTFLADALADLSRREPTASVVVLTRNPEQADQAYQALRRTDLANLNRVADQDFSFGPGIEITDVSQTKGLEFDYVVMLNVDRAGYPNTPAARHLLHVGCTRAIHQLWLLAWNPASPLLPDWLESRVAG